MGTYEFKTHIKKIRKEAIEIGFSISTMDDYQKIWNSFIKWKNEDNFIYSEEDYSNFLLDYYHFDVTTFSNESKSRYQKLMRSKRILDDFDSYKVTMQMKCLPSALYSEYPSKWNVYLENYINYCKNDRCNGESSLRNKKKYLIRLLSYFYNSKVSSLNEINRDIIITFINETIDKGNISKRRNFYVLRDFLNYLFIEGILQEDLSYLVPKIKRTQRKKIPTYLKPESVENLLSTIPKETDVQKRDYAIILIAARLGLRLSDILNIKLKDIDWKNHKLMVYQTKNNNLNNLPLTKEVGWAIIDYIKNGRPICNNEFLFVKHKYPFEKLNQFNSFNKYFDKVDVEFNSENKKGIHNLRHSLATNLLNNEIPVNIIASSLGDSIETTSKTYIKVNKNKLKECFLEVEDE